MDIHPSIKGTMTMRTRSTERIKNEMNKLREELRQAELHEAERLGRLAVKAGLHEAQASDRTLLKGLRDLAQQFQAEPTRDAQAERAEAGND